MCELGCGHCFPSGAPRRGWRASSHVSSAARFTGRVRPNCALLGGCLRESRKQLQKDLLLDSSECVGKRCAGFGQKRKRVLLWMHSEHKPLPADFCVANLATQKRSGLRRGQGRLCDKSPRLRNELRRLSNELQSLCEAGQLDQAVDILFRMDHQGPTPSVTVYRSLLKACSRRKALHQAKRVHGHLCKTGLETSLAEFVVSSLVKCGGLEDALQVFHRSASRSVFSWTAIISGYVASGQIHEAYRMYHSMVEEGVQPNGYTIVSLLKTCNSSGDLEEGRRLHAEALKYGCDTELVVQTCLVDMYGKCGSIVDAQNVFKRMFQRDVVSWNAMLAAYAQLGQAEKALQLYEQMQVEDVSVNDRTFVSALQACGLLAEKEEDVVVDGRCIKMKSLEKGRAIDADAQRKGYHVDVFVANTLVSMYGRCGSIEDAQNVFKRLTQRNVVSWNAMLAAYVEHGQGQKALQLYEQMLVENVSPNHRSFVSGIKACAQIAETEDYAIAIGQPTKVKCLTKGKELHTDARSKGCDTDVFVVSALVSLYAKCGSIVDAHTVFDGLLHRDVGMWNAMLSAYIEQGNGEEAVQLYEQMLEQVLCPDARSFVRVLQACGMLAEREVDVTVDGRAIKAKGLEKGKAIHADAQSKGYNSDAFVGSALLNMYGKCWSIADAQNVFDGLSQRDVVTWTAMIAAYVDHGQAEKALQLYHQMQLEGVSPNEGTFVSSLQACGILAEMGEGIVDSSNINYLHQGKEIHAETRKKGYDANIAVGSTIISMYGKCGSIADAQNVFDGLSHRDVVAWTAMLTAYVELGFAEKALQLYEQMCEEGVCPDEITVVWFLQACSTMGNLALLRQIHHNLVVPCESWSPLFASSLINAYGRCASMVDAQTVFDALPDADVVSWNALIAGYARQGDCAASLQCYEKMQILGVKGDEVTFLSILSACSYAGLVIKGTEYFTSMSKDHGIAPGIEHYVCMVDLLGRGGCFSRIETLLSEMQMPPSLAIWVCLLGACQKHGRVELAKQAFDSAVYIEPKHPAAYVLMSNIYAEAGLSHLANQVQQLRQASGAWKQPGRSWIGHENEVHCFVVGDRQHPQQRNVYELLYEASFNQHK